MAISFDTLLNESHCRNGQRRKKVFLNDFVALGDLDYEEDHECDDCEGQDSIQEVPDSEGLACQGDTSERARAITEQMVD